MPIPPTLAIRRAIVSLGRFGRGGPRSVLTGVTMRGGACEMHARLGCSAALGELQVVADSEIVGGRAVGYAIDRWPEMPRGADGRRRNHDA